MPEERTNVAWFDRGPLPGENGTAIVVGHYGWNNMKESAFDNLHKLSKGDKLYVEDDKGVTLSFVVREIRRYDKDTVASAVFRQSIGRSYLNLITCEGEWGKISKTYSKRLVVFAERHEKQ